MDDSSVSSVGVNRVRKSHPYILFYIKKTEEEEAVQQEIEESMVNSRKQSGYEEGNITCHRKRSYSQSMENDIKMFNKRRKSSDMVVMGEIKRNKKLSDQIDDIFSKVEKRRNSEDLMSRMSDMHKESVIDKADANPMLYKKREDLDLMELVPDKEPPVLKLKMEIDEESNGMEIEKVEEDVEFKKVEYEPVVVPAPPLRQPLYSKLNRLSRMRNLQLLSRKKLITKPKPVVSLLQQKKQQELPPDLTEQIENYTAHFGNEIKEKDKYDLEYDQGKQRKKRKRKKKRKLNFQKQSEKKQRKQ